MASERFKVETERHRIFLEHAQGLAMEDYHWSCATIDVKRKRTKIDPKGQKHEEGEIKEILIDEYPKQHVASSPP